MDNNLKFTGAENVEAAEVEAKKKNKKVIIILLLLLLLFIMLLIGGVVWKNKRPTATLGIKDVNPDYVDTTPTPVVKETPPVLEEMPPVPIINQKIKIVPNITNWTNEDILVSISYDSIEGARKLVSIDNGNTFNEYTGTVKISSNTKVVARLEGENYNIIAEESLHIQNIDKLPPKEFNITATSSNKTVMVNAYAEDAEATNENGKSEIKEYEYKITKGEWQKVITSEENICEFNMLQGGETYKVQVCAIDNAGNKTISAEIDVEVKATSKLTVNPNGGTWEGSADIKDVEQEYGTTRKIPEPTRIGYTFKEWKITNGGSIVDGAYTYGEADEIITAEWEINEYTLTFNANGGIVTQDKITENYDTSITLPTPTVSNYTVSYNTDGGNTISSDSVKDTFTGWYTEIVAGEKKEYTKMPAVDETLYAHWDKTKIELPLPLKTGYKFKGWYEDSTYTTKVGNAGDEYTPISDITLYAKWEINQYTLIFNANGGLVGADAHIRPSTQCSIKQDYNSTITLPTPTREHIVTFNTVGGTAISNETATYTFMGWYTDRAAGEERTYTKMPAVDETLYAHWNNTSTNITLGTPTKEGYTFEGWYKDSAYTTKVGNAGDEYTPTSDVTLYAKWEINEYTLTLDANGGLVGAGPVSARDTITADYGTSIILPVPTKVHTVAFNTNGGNVIADKTSVYTFMGWYTDKAAGEERKYVSMPAVNETLYAHWNNTSTSIALPTPTKSGCIFEGWYEDSALTTKVGNAGDEYTPTADVTLYVKWETNQYTLTLDANGGLVGAGPVSACDTITADYGTTITLPVPTKEYTIGFDTDGGPTIADVNITYTFMGWYTDKTAGEERTYTKMPAVDETLYAHWDNTTSKLILPTVTETGYTFKGWYEDRGLTTKVGDAGDEYEPTKDITLYAKWEINQYTLTFDANGGLVGAGPVSACYSITDDYAEPITMPTPSREYIVTLDANRGVIGTIASVRETATYTFVGWYTSATAGDKKEYIEMPAADETLYAHWDNTSASITLASPTRLGYTFEGWYEDVALTTKVGNAGDNYTPTSDITLYAKWEINEYTLTLDANGGLVGASPVSARDTITADYGASITMPIPTKEYTVSFDTVGGNTILNQNAIYTFTGWYTNATAGEERTYTTMPAADETLYAHWDNTSAEITLPIPTKAGYTFEGWYEDNTYTTRVGNAGDNYTPTSDITLCAKWETNEYTLTLDANGGLVGSGPVFARDTITADYDTSITMPTPTKEYIVSFDTNGGNAISNQNATYTFTGWYTSATAGDKKEYTKMPAADETLYAHWDNTSAEITLPMPIKTGYEFAGWYEDSSLITKVGDNGEKYTPTKNVTLYAEWKVNPYTLTFDATGGELTSTTIREEYGKDITMPTPIKEYTVSFNTDGGSAISNETITYTFAGWYTSAVGGDKKEYTKMPSGDETLYAHWNETGIKITLGAPTKDGYTFEGWYQEAALTTKVGNAGDEYTPTSDVTLYAKWEINEYTLTLDANGGLVGSGPVSARDTITEDYGTSITLPTPTREHIVAFNTDGGNVIANETVTYNFIGWYTDPVSGEERTYTSMPTGGETLYAHWNGTSAKITLPMAVKAGYTFDGWYEDTALTIKVGDVGEIYAPTRDITLCAKWETNQYTLTLDANGGLVGAGPVSARDAITADYGASIILPTPTREHIVAFDTDGGPTIADVDITYTFMGWYTDPVSGEERTYTSMPAADEDLYAHWDSITSRLILPTVTETGYTFKGWYEDAALTTKVGDAGDEYEPTKDITLYAKWEINQYTLTFDANGGLVGAGPVSTRDTITDDYAEPITMPTPSREYAVSFNTNGGSTISNETVTYTFDGWYTSATGGDKKEYIEMPAADETLYAHWTSAYIALQSPTKAGCIFEGWYEDAALTTKVGNAGDNYTPTTDITLYAKWEINQYTLTLDANGGLVGAGPVSARDVITADYGASITLPTPTREHIVAFDTVGGDAISNQTSAYTFVGWYTDPVSGEERTYTSMPAADETLYAHWDDTSIKVTLPLSTRLGYTFEGWYEDNAYTTKVGNAGDYYTPTTDITLCAKWELSSYTLTLNPTGGLVGAGPVSASDTITANYGASIALPTPTKEHTVAFNTDGGTAISSETVTFNFEGWYTELTGGDKREYTTMPAGDETLYAHWNNSGASITLSDPAKTGYTFDGWYEDNTYTTKVGNAGDVYIPTGDITLYAKWNVKQYTLTFDANGGTVTTNSITEPYNESISMPVPTMNGYTITFNTDGGNSIASKTVANTFAGWYTDKTAGDQRTYTAMPAADEALYAHWNTANYTLPKPTKSGFEFGAWFEDSACTILAGGAGETYIPTKDVTLYAKWVAVYAKLYDDGTLVLTATDRTISGKTLYKDFGNIAGKTSAFLSSSTYQNKVTSVNIADKIYPITTAYWFSNCKNLTTINNIENLDTSNVTNMQQMFYYCKGLTSLDLSNFNTSNVTNMNSMFNSCSGLTSLDLSPLDTSNVTNMQSIFAGCSGLTSLDLSPLDTSNVTNMSYMFNGCSGLTSLDLTPLDTANATSMLSMFNGCSGLTSIDLRPLKTTNVTDMSWMFYGCSGLTSIDLSPLNTSNVTTMYYMFGGCSGLTSIDLSPLDTSKVTNMSYMFCNSTGLTSINLTSIDTSNVTNMSSMFSICRGLTNIDLSPLDTTNVTDMSYMFSGCTVLTSIDLSPLDTSNVTTMCYMFGECYGLTSIDLSPLDTTNVTTMEYMFRYCTGLTSIDLTPLKTTNVTNMRSIFEGCSGLTSIDLTPLDTSNVTTMLQMFNGCSGLTSIDLSPLDTSNVINMQSMFAGCSGLTSIDLSPLKTTNVTDMSWMFNGCSGLTSIDLTPLDTTNVTTMNGMFSKCTGLTGIDLTPLKTTNVTNMANMFASCSGLTSLDLRPLKTTNVTNMYGMFSGCTGLTSINLSGFVTTNVTSMSYMFANCSGLKSLSLSSFKTTNVTNMSYMFYGCSGLSTLSLTSFDTSNISMVGMDYMFAYCTKLTKISVSSTKWTTASRSTNIFYNCGTDHVG